MVYGIMEGDPVAIAHGARQIEATHADVDATHGQLRAHQYGVLPGNWNSRGARTQQAVYADSDEVMKLRVLAEAQRHGANLSNAGTEYDQTELTVNQFQTRGDSGSDSTYAALSPNPQLTA
ncbi:hypothetical protein WEI85_24825 [Actinomycetes bacterium KLBMP 9797]